MNKILYYPNDGDHFVDMYLDKIKYAGLIARHDLYERYMHGKLTDEEAELDCFKGPYAGVAWDYSILKNRIFHAAVQSFSDELCRRFAGRCVENFYAAPGGKEEEWIESTPTPNIYEYGQYERLNGWYGGLAGDSLHKLVCRFEDELGPVVPDDPHFKEKCNDSWNRLAVEVQERIYEYYNPENDE